MNGTRNKDQVRSYKSFVAAQTKRTSCLHELFEFLQNDSASQRACRIVCLEFSSTSGPPARRSLDLDELEAYLSNTTKRTGDLCGRLLIVEDLSSEIIKTLGSSLNIDPLFFASHIDTFQADIATTRPSTAALPSTTRAQKFLNLHYHRVIEFENLESKQVLLRDMNVPRKVKTLPRTKGINVGLVRHCCSILKTEGKDGFWLGLILVDPPISNSYVSRHPHDGISTTLALQTRLFQGGFQDFLSGPSFADNIDPESGPKRSSPLDSLIFYCGVQQPQGFDVNCPSLFSIAHYPLRMVAAEWMTYLELIYHSIKQYEYSPNNAVAAIGQIAILNADIYALQQWIRRCVATAQKIHYVIDFLRYRLTKDDDKEYSALLIEDYKHIASSIDSYSHRLDTLMSAATSLIQAIDSRRSLTETINISRLTYLALSFIPLTFVSGLFSMNDNIASGGKLFGLYFAVSIPLCILVFLIIRPPTSTLAVFAARLWRSRATQKLLV